MSKHTKGPWDVSHGGHGSPHGFVIDEYFVLNRAVADDVAIAADIVDPATQMPSEANALLIAAAPELLRALQAVVNDCHDLDMVPSNERGRTTTAFELAVSAIEKATGEG